MIRAFLILAVLAGSTACKDKAPDAEPPKATPTAEAKPEPEAKAAPEEKTEKVEEAVKPELPALGEVPGANLLGKIGFDWFAPESSTCTVADAAMLTKLSADKITCKRETEAPFEGDDMPWLRCTAPDKKAEYLFFEDESACKDQFETMEANAP